MICEAQIGIGDKPRLCSGIGSSANTRASLWCSARRGSQSPARQGGDGEQEASAAGATPPRHPAWMRVASCIRSWSSLLPRRKHGPFHTPGRANIILRGLNEMPFLNIAENSDNFANDFFARIWRAMQQKLPLHSAARRERAVLQPDFCARTNPSDTSDYHQGRSDVRRRAGAYVCRITKRPGARHARVMLDGVFSPSATTACISTAAVPTASTSARTATPIRRITNGSQSAIGRTITSAGGA